jgi:hypothetical protein
MTRAVAHVVLTFGTWRTTSFLRAEQTRADGRIASAEVIQTMREPFLAGILSLLIPGLGQIYNGQIISGILWLLLTGVSWIGTAGMLGWIVHIIAAYFAYSYAKEHPVR